MHAEYAVEPAAIGANWETFRYLIEKFGLDRGRLISRFPKDWERKVFEAAKEAGISGVKLTTVVEKLNAAKKIKVFDFGRNYRLSDTWIANAVREHNARPFHAIIYSGGQPPCPASLVTDQCDDENALFAASASRDVVRNSDSISGALHLIAASAHEIDIVDPFFDLRPQKGDFIGPLAALLAKLAASGSAPKIIRVHFRTHDSRPPDTILLRDAPRQTRGMIPAGYVLELYEWAEVPGGEDFHDRFFLTEAGGIMVGAGFSAVGASETTAFTLLDDGHAQAVRARYAATTTVYSLVGSAVRIDSTGAACLISSR